MGPVLPTDIVAAAARRDAAASRMTYVNDTKDYLRQMALETFRAEYQEVHQTWRNLESKAQANITLAGIFLAAALAYIEKINPAPNPMEKFLLIAALVLLGASVTLSVFVLLVRDIIDPPMGKFVRKYLPPLLRRETEKDLRAAIDIAFNQANEAWRKATERARERNAEKAQHLTDAQGLLVAAIALFAVLTIARVVTLGGPSKEFGVGLLAARGTPDNVARVADAARAIKESGGQD